MTLVKMLKKSQKCLTQNILLGDIHDYSAIVESCLETSSSISSLPDADHGVDSDIDLVRFVFVLSTFY